MTKKVADKILEGLNEALSYVATMDESARNYDLNGWFEVADNPISREGIFPYSGAQIGAPAGEASRIFKVYRPAEELSSADTLASFRLVPIIDDHVMLGEGHTAAEDKGVAGTIGENVKFSDGLMTANLKVFSKTLAQKIKNGKTELSCGYRCVYDFTPGVWNGQEYDVVQRQIRANHLALVDEGRMGPDIRVLDHMTFTVDAKEFQPVDEELKAALAAIMARLDKLEAAETSEDEETTTETTETTSDDDTTEETTSETETTGDEDVTEEAKAMDAVLKEMRSLRKEVATLKARPAMDEKSVMATIANKGALVDRLKPHIGVFDHSAMTYADVAKYGVEKLGIKNVAAGTEAIALDAYLQARPVAVVHATAADSAATDLGKGIAAYASGKK